jgi:xylan 1,4-beta-xylosidase
LEIYKVGYKSNDAYATYLAMGRPSQLNKQQVEQIKKQNNGSPFAVEKININGNKVFEKLIDIRENDVYLLKLIKQ